MGSIVSHASDVISSLVSVEFYRSIPNFSTSRTVFYAVQFCFYAALVFSLNSMYGMSGHTAWVSQINWDDIRGTAAFIWPDNLEINIPYVGDDNHREIRINMDLPFSIAIPEEYLKKGDQDDGETTRTPENTPKKTSEKRSASTSVMETQKKPKSASFIVFDSFSRLISIEKVQKCEFWKSAIIVGKREIVFCATEEGSSTIPHSVYLDDFSSVLPEKINRAYLLSIVDVVESQILPRLTNFLLFFLFGFAWFGVTFFYLTWWLFTLSFYGIFSFILFSSARSCFSVNLPYTFGQVLQLCSYNLTLPFLVGFFRSDFWGYFIGFGFMVYSLVTKPQHHRHHRNH